MQVPQQVNDRILNRILVFAGVPVFFGFSLFPLFYYLKVRPHAPGMILLWHAVHRIGCLFHANHFPPRNVPCNYPCHMSINKLRFMQLVYDTSGCSSQGFSWSPSDKYLNRSKLASTRLCNNHITILLLCHCVSLCCYFITWRSRHVGWAEHTELLYPGYTVRVPDGNVPWHAILLVIRA